MINWDALGAIGELLGSILLLGSLIYVGLQIRDAKLQIRSAASQARTDAFVDLWKTRLIPEVVQAEFNARLDPDDISDEDRHYLVAFITMFLNHYQNTFYQLKVGALENDQVGALETLPMFRAVPYYRKLWKDGMPKDSYNKEFIAHVDAVVENLDKKEGSENA